MKPLANRPLVAEPVPLDTPPLRIALVSCGKAKLTHPAPARYLYTGSLFRAARSYVERSGYDAWWILSARHGLVHPDEVLGPYEATLTGRGEEELTRWANKVDSRLRCSNYGLWSQAGGQIEMDIFAGKAYVDPLLSHHTLRALTETNTHTNTWTINVPHAGLQIGERLAAFAAPIHAPDPQEGPPT